MGREAKVRKDRTCFVCKKEFMNLSAPQIEMHSIVCSFEERTGIEVIRMKEPEVEVVVVEEPLIQLTD